MSTFHCAGGMNITGGNFSDVHRDQINNYNSYDLHFEPPIERNPIRFRPGEEWKEMLYQEYERIPLGRIKILRTLCRQSVVTSRRRRIMANSRREDQPEAERIVEVASIVNGRKESAPLLTIRYIGRDAQKFFKEDLILFCRERSPTIPPLRAFNDHDIPTIIFHEELVSAHHFLTHHRHSLYAQCYLDFQVCLSGFLGGVSAELRTWILSTSEKFQPDLTHLLWFHPNTGILFLGPPGPRLEYQFDGYDREFLYRCYVERPDVIHLELPPLPLDVCNDATFLDHMIHNLPELLAVEEISSSTACHESGATHRGVYLWKEHTVQTWTDWHSSRRVLQIPTDRWYYNLDYAWPCTTGQGSEICFRYTRSLTFPSFTFEPDGPEWNVSSRSRHAQWLTQAGWIFSRLRVPREEWSFYAIIDKISLQLSFDENQFGIEDNDWNNVFDPPCYLYMSPPPRLPNGAPDIETWLRGENLYHYSYDPQGGSAITEEERISLKLPSFTSEAWVNYTYWDTAAYDFMEHWQNAKGFDYHTTDYAESLGIPDLEVIPQDGCRLEDLTECRHEDEDPAKVFEDIPMDVDTEIADIRGDCILSLSSDVDMNTDSC
ncbi:hypothetical protein PM082_016851 [Marasmius tenuissimus]|nr:hypothetical protein PM082_016851 [Marasmius tenuissimus]